MPCAMSICTRAVCFSTRPISVDQAVVHQAVGRVIVASWDRASVECSQTLGLIVPIRARIADGSRIADERHAVAARLGDVAAADRHSAVVVVHEDRVAADLVDEAVLEGAVLRAGSEDRAAAVDRPVAAQQRFLVVHEGPGGVAEGESLEADESHRRLLRAAELDEVPQADGLDGRRAPDPRRRADRNRGCWSCASRNHSPGASSSSKMFSTKRNRACMPHGRLFCQPPS